MKIIIAVNGGPSSEYIVSYGSALAASANGQVALVTIVDPYIKTQLRIDLTHEVRRLANIVPKNIRVTTIVRPGSFVSEIGRVAEEWQADYLVVGKQRWSMFNLLFQKNNPNRMLRKLNLPVLTVPTKKSVVMLRPGVSEDAINTTLLAEYER